MSDSDSDTSMMIPSQNVFPPVHYEDIDLKTVLGKIQAGTLDDNPIEIYDYEIAVMEQELKENRWNVAHRISGPFVCRGVPRAVNGLFPHHYAEGWYLKTFADLREARLEFLRPQRHLWVLAAECWSTSKPTDPDHDERVDKVRDALDEWNAACDDAEVAAHVAALTAAKKNAYAAKKNA